TKCRRPGARGLCSSPRWIRTFFSPCLLARSLRGRRWSPSLRSLAFTDDGFRIVHVRKRKPSIVIALLRHVADSREVHVRHGHEGPVLCGIGEIPLPACRRSRRIDDELEADVWLIELNVRHVEQVAAQ